VEALKALKVVVDVKHKLVNWLSQYRSVDVVSISVRLLRESYAKTKGMESWDDDFFQKLVDAELDVIKELVSILDEEIDNKFPNETIRNARRSTNNILGGAPISRANHFMYAILDLIQQHAESLGSDDPLVKVKNHISKTALRVAKESPYSYLRCKAFEVLATMKPRLADFTDTRIEYEMSGSDDDVRKTALEQWRAIQLQVEKMQQFLNTLSEESQELETQIFAETSV